MTVVADERRLLAWHDRDRDGSWQGYTLCHGCAEVKHCRGKERDRVRCRACYMRDVLPVPMFELGLWDYSDTAGAKREHARGLAILEQRKSEAAEARRQSLEASRLRQREEHEQRDRTIARLVAEGGSYEQVAGLFGLSAATVRKLAGQSRTRPANPHGCAGKNAEMTGDVCAPHREHTPARKRTEKAHTKAALTKRRRTFVQREARQRDRVLELRERGLLPAVIADELGLSDRTVRRYLAQQA